jgi:hypothetical protein
MLSFRRPPFAYRRSAPHFCLCVQPATSTQKEFEIVTRNVDDIDETQHAIAKPLQMAKNNKKR